MRGAPVSVLRDSLSMLARLLPASTVGSSVISACDPQFATLPFRLTTVAPDVPRPQARSVVGTFG